MATNFGSPRHRRIYGVKFQPSPAGTRSPRHSYPPLKRRAIVVRPLRGLGRLAVVTPPAMSLHARFSGPCLRTTLLPLCLDNLPANLYIGAHQSLELAGPLRPKGEIV